MTFPRRAGAVLAGLLLLAGCGSPAVTRGEEPSTSTTSSAATPAPAAASATAVDVSGTDWGHVHNLAFDDEGALLLGTHEGLYRQPPGQPPVLLSDTTFDVMGLAHDGRRWLASGHPAEGEDLPDDLGLRESPDGRSWTTVSLLGEVDFHRLTASGRTVLGVSAHDGGLLRSTDAGRTWTRLDNPGAFDIALDPASPQRAVATTKTGPVLTSDTGDTWAPAAEAPVIAFAAWTDDAVLGVAPDGSVHASTDGGATWQVRGDVGGRPGAVTARSQRLAVLVGDSVRESTDGGRTFVDRITGIGGH